jgi:hypothetical protein
MIACVDCLALYLVTQEGEEAIDVREGMQLRILALQ